jgi:hypothetical protein
MKTISSLCFVLSVTSLTGCGMFSPPPVQPSDISVESALVSVGDGLSKLKGKLDAENMKLGMYVDTVQLELDLTTDKKGDGKLSVDFSKGFQLGPQLGMEQTVDANRGSKLTIILKQAMVPVGQGGNVQQAAANDTPPAASSQAKNQAVKGSGAAPGSIPLVPTTVFGIVAPSKILGVPSKVQ